MGRAAAGPEVPRRRPAHRRRRPREVPAPVKRPAGGGAAPAAAGVFGVGAAAYAAALGPGGLTFDATPAFLGAVVLVAAAVTPRRRHLVAPGSVLALWGAAVLLVRQGPLPDDREAPAFVVGVALGLLVVALLGRRPGSAASPAGAAATAVLGGTAFYVAYDIAWLGRWPAWALALVAWGLWEALPRPAARTP